MLTKEDLQAIAEMMDLKLESIKEEIALARHENNETRSIIETRISQSIEPIKEEIALARHENNETRSIIETRISQSIEPIKEEIALARRENNETRSIIETQICHSIDLLVEGHKEILATIKRDFADKRQLDQERVRIYALEETVTEHTAQIQELQQDLQRKTG